MMMDGPKPLILAAVSLAVTFAAVAACAERRAERALKRAVADAPQASPASARAALEEIARRWPKTRAAGQARQEIEWLDEFELASRRGEVLLAWDAVRRVGRAAERFRLDKGRYPRTFDELVPRHLSGPVLDPWGHEVEYRAVAGGYQAVCYGSDGIPGGARDAADILVENSQLKIADSPGADR